MIEFGEKLNTPLVLCLGFFDCMHKGHMALYYKARQLADSINAKVALFTFSNSHFDVLKNNVKQIYTFDERIQIYKNTGVDEVLSARFDRAFMSTTGEKFLQTLFDTLNLKAIVCGFDYSCGCDMLSSFRVSEFCRKHGADCFVVDAVTENGVKISSTLVRELITQCNIKQVNSLLSQNYFVSGVVTHGRQIGRRLGFPTANIEVCDRLLPQGVFAGYTVIDGVNYKAIINIGSKPTFNDKQCSVEAHVIGYDGNLYGKLLCLCLTDFLRNIKKFNSEDELKTQLQKDLQKVKEYD